MSGLSSEESSLSRMRFKQARCPELFDELEIRGSTPAGEHESLDYDSVFNRGYLEEFRQQQGRRQWFGYSGATLRRWVLTVLVGILIGFIAFVLGAAIEEATLAKSTLLQMNNPDYTDEKLLPFAYLCSINVLLAVAAAVPTIWLAPEAASSGIPEVMGYLNGVHISGLLRLRTLLVKVFGTFCAVCSGFAVGPEGPLVHTGAIVGSGVTRGHKVWRWQGQALWRCHMSLLQTFHNDTDRRDFISMGAAVGFATAFGAPVGGVLFAMEEASSFWNGKLMWRTLLATTLGCFTVALCRR